jgi:hypothetical protein
MLFVRIDSLPDLETTPCPPGGGAMGAHGGIGLRDADWPFR